MSFRIGSSCGQVVDDLGGAFLALDEIVHHAASERARTVQGHEGDQVLEALRLHLDDDVPHARRFELEDAGGLAAAEKLVGLRVVQGEAADGETVRRGERRFLEPLVDQCPRPSG